MISIHAPARGATPSQTCRCPRRSISIHAPARGATGRDLCHSRFDGISIHAPARGATRTGACCSPRRRNFNPRSREGSDNAGAIRAVIAARFQSTLPRGERHALSEVVYCEPEISIHAPARGATRSPRLEEGVTNISIHAPARGATQERPLNRRTK